MTATRPGVPVAPAAPPLEVAAARAAVYRLLGRLHLVEVDGPVLEALRAWPAFAPSLTTGDDADLLARLRAEYARLFLLNAHPYESVYVDPSAMLGGQASVAVEEAYAGAGFEVGGVPPPGAPDHAGAEMLFLSALVETERAALAAGGDRPLSPGRTAAAAARARQRRFLEAHLAAWLPPFALSVARDARHPFYRALAEETLAFVLADLHRLAATGLPVVSGGAGQAEEEPLEARDLAGVAAHLAAPARAGFHLSREEVHRLAARLAVPVAMLERPRMLEMLFEGAARFEVLPALLEHLGADAYGAAARYGALAAEYPGAAAALARWARRASATADALLAMRRAAAGAA